MNAAIMNAYSFTVRGLIAAAEAARSLERMESVWWPSLPRLMNPTQTATRMQQTRQTQPNTGDGMFPSMPLNPAFTPSLGPRNVAYATGKLFAPPPQLVYLKPKFSIAAAPARVTTARDTPRTLTAET